MSVNPFDTLTHTHTHTQEQIGVTNDDLEAHVRKNTHVQKVQEHMETKSIAENPKKETAATMADSVMLQVNEITFSDSAIVTIFLWTIFFWLTLNAFSSQNNLKESTAVCDDNKMYFDIEPIPCKYSVIPFNQSLC